MENRIRTLGICTLILIVSLYVVGIASHGIIRHTVQTAPLWLAVWFGFRRSRWAKWVALSPLVLWLLLMINIWLLMFGLPHLLSGSFSPIEIAMTITIGVAALVGIATALRIQTVMPWINALGTLLLMTARKYSPCGSDSARSLARPVVVGRCPPLSPLLSCVSLAPACPSLTFRIALVREELCAFSGTLGKKPRPICLEMQ